MGLYNINSYKFRHSRSIILLSNDQYHDTDVSGENVDIKVTAEMVRVNEKAVLALYERTYEISSGKKVL